MNVKRFVCCLLASVLLLGVSLISCGNSSRAKAKNEIAQSGEDFKSFLDKFTSSAAFQYTRIKCSKQVMRNQKSTCVSNLNRLPMGNGM